MPDRRVERFLVSLMACNADDGTACGMPGMAAMRHAFTSANADFIRLHPSAPNSEFMKLLRHECLGSPDLPLAPRRPAQPPHSALCSTPLGVPTISTIVTVGTLVRLMSAADKSRLGRRGVRFSTSVGTPGSYASSRASEMLVNRLAGAPTAERVFTPAPDESHGRPYVWFTPKEDLDAALRTRRAHGRAEANIARDLLGLIHHGPVSRETGGPNHLFAIHMPAAVAVAATHMRPAAPQAFDNRRFVLWLNGQPTGPDEWGWTLDLDYFATRAAGLPTGARERVLLRLQASVLAPGEVIAFDYLGPVTSTRGDIGRRDDDATFLELVRRGRPVDALIIRMCR